MASQQQPVSIPRAYLEFYNACVEQSSYFKPLKATVPKVEKWNVGTNLILGNTSFTFDGYSVYIPTIDENGNPMRFTVFIVAPPGRGKTKLIKNLIVQLKQMGYAVIVLCDPRMEMMDLMTKMPQPSPYWPRGFKPQKMPVKTYLPEYCLPRGRQLPSGSKMHDATLIKISMSDVEFEDLLTLLRYIDEDDKSTRNAKSALKKAWNTFTEMYPKKEQRTFDRFMQCIQQIPLRTGRSEVGGGTHPDTVNKIYEDMTFLNEDGVLGDSKINIIQDILDGYIPVLSNMDSRQPHFDSAYASVVSRPVYNDRQGLVHGVKPKLPPVCYIPDEMQRIGFVGSHFADFISMDVIRSGRVPVQNFIGSTQVIVPPSNTPDKSARKEVSQSIVEFCDYIICFSGLSPEDISFIRECRNIDKEDAEIFAQLNEMYNPSEYLSPAVLLARGRPPQMFYPLPLMAGHTFEQSGN